MFVEFARKRMVLDRGAWGSLSNEDHVEILTRIEGIAEDYYHMKFHLSKMEGCGCQPVNAQSDDRPALGAFKHGEQ